MLKGSCPDLVLLLTCSQEKGSVPREKLEDGYRLLGWFWGTRGTQGCCSWPCCQAVVGRGKQPPGHGASNDGDRLGKGACGSEVTALLGGARLREEPREQVVPPATGSAGLVWERRIKRQLMSLAV